MTYRVGINGFGRIGRLVFRAWLKQKPVGVEIVHVNDLFDPTALAMTLKYDSVHGKLDHDVRAEGSHLVVGPHRVLITNHKNPAEIPWENVDVVIESSGVFTSKKTEDKPGFDSHFAHGVKRVLLTVPAKGEIDGTIVLGVNDHELNAGMKTVSNASCTTNCVAPMAKILHEAFGIRKGLMTTVHAYTMDQRLHDSPHKDMRRARAAAENIVPTTTGAAKAVGKVIPALKGKLDGLAMRVPVPDGSITDLVVELEKDVTQEQVLEAFRQAAAGPMKGILEYNTDPIVSSDIIGNDHSCIFDADQTMVLGNLVKVVGWYDNEWGYSCRVIDLLARMCELG